VTTLVLVGGYLGAGKTTLILRAAEMLRARGRRAGVILNDQDTGLVDTRLSEAAGVEAREVAGGCFCCRFGGLVEAAEALRAAGAEVILAEPAGSCIDVAATVVQPLLQYYRPAFRVAPLSVLVDPARRSGYLVEQQIAEADLILSAKADVREGVEGADFRVSGATGEGVAEWLDEVLSGRRVAGARLLEVDYDRYAAEEAALAWVNLHAECRLEEAASPAMVAGPLLEAVEESLAEIAHLKVFVRASTGWVKASVCAKGEAPVAQGDLLADAAVEHEIVVNVRAPGDPDEIRAVVERALPRGSVIRYARAFRPSYPRPQHRLRPA
jgi:hypothetical protein